MKLRDKIIAELMSRYWQTHPRLQFITRLPVEARVLDLGAGAGRAPDCTLPGDRARRDLHWHAVDRKPKPPTASHTTWTVANLETDRLPWNNRTFEAVFFCHTLEHLTDTCLVQAEIARLLAPGGLVYLETPSPHSREAPTTNQLAERGVRVIRGRFDDDPGHVHLYTRGGLGEFLNAAGCLTIESGEVWNDALADDLLHIGLALDHLHLTTYGHWLRTRWSQYVIGRRCLEEEKGDET